MKITTDKPDSFKPVSMTIIFESKNELDAFAALFNHSEVLNAYEGFAKTRPNFITDKARLIGAEIYDSDAFNSITNALQKRK